MRCSSAGIEGGGRGVWWCYRMMIPAFVAVSWCGVGCVGWRGGSVVGGREGGGIGEGRVGMARIGATVRRRRRARALKRKIINIEYIYFVTDNTYILTQPFLFVLLPSYSFPFSFLSTHAQYLLQPTPQHSLMRRKHTCCGRQTAHRLAMTMTPAPSLRRNAAAGRRTGDRAGHAVGRSSVIVSTGGGARPST